MPNLEVIIFNQRLKLSYQENEKQRILIAVEKLNKKWQNFSNLHGKVSDLKIATLISLELQDLIDDKNKLNNKNKLKERNIESLKKEIEYKKKESEENIENIKKLKIELNDKNKELNKLDSILDDFHNELIQIKNNILKNNE
tara:strand:- start:464 stop:889 length:426 start_codon:yes stop_codon:yes gene_type:complete